MVILVTAEAKGISREGVRRKKSPGAHAHNKFEARNPKFETNSNGQNLNDQNKNDNSKQFRAFVLNFEHLNFGFVSDFDIRISDLLILVAFMKES
jgi:hypothetical protein